jgi:hypothetical protein
VARWRGVLAEGNRPGFKIGVRQHSAHEVGGSADTASKTGGMAAVMVRPTEVPVAIHATAVIRSTDCPATGSMGGP